MPYKVRREGMLHTNGREQKGKRRKEEKYLDRHASLNTRRQIHLHARDETVQLPPGIEKKWEGGEKRVESTESGSNPSWIGHLVRKKSRGKEMSNSYTKMHRHTKQVLKAIKAI